MKDIDITDLLKKAEELRALFILGQRVIPFLEEIFRFVSEIKPLLDEINSSIAENLKKMPNASKQLSKVTQATESATNEIMDIVDGLNSKADLISKNINQIVRNESNKTAYSSKAYDLLLNAIQNNANIDDVLPKITGSVDNFRNQNKYSVNTDDVVTTTQDLINSIKEDSTSIMISLQVQDITSQQIAAVNHLLQTVQGRLENILDRFHSSELNDILKPGAVVAEKVINDNTNVTMLHREIAFDPDAVDSISFKESRQNEVDELLLEQAKIQENTKKTISTELNVFSAKQDSSNISNNKLVDKKAEIKAGEEDIDQFSQEEIDALFGK
jgi:chemotaxis regulatin CheY-phosphate phosphatase CheZ